MMPVKVEAEATPQVIERERYVERDATPAAGSQVNVNAGPATPAYVAVEPGPMYYAKRIVSFFFGVLMVLLLIRIVLLLGGANQDNGLVNMLMGITYPFVAPFYGVFNFDQVHATGQSVFEIAALVAMLGWGLIWALILGILSLADRRPAEGV